MIYPIADQLNIPRLRVYANNILFDNNGSYVGFDKNELTSKLQFIYLYIYKYFYFFVKTKNGNMSKYLGMVVNQQLFQN